MDREVARMTQKVLSLGWSGIQEERQVLGGKMRFCFCFWTYWIWDVWGPSKKRCLAGNWIYRYGTCKSAEQWHNTLTTAVIRGFTNLLTYIPSPIPCAFCSSAFLLFFLICLFLMCWTVLSQTLDLVSVGEPSNFLVCSGNLFGSSVLFYFFLPPVFSNFSGILGGRRDGCVISLPSWTWSQKLWIEVLFCFLESLIAFWNALNFFRQGIIISFY